MLSMAVMCFQKCLWLEHPRHTSDIRSPANVSTDVTHGSMTGWLAFQPLDLAFPIVPRGLESTGTPHSVPSRPSLIVAARKS